MFIISPLFNMVLEILANAIRQDKSTRGIRSGNKEVKLLLSAGKIIVYMKHLITDKANSKYFIKFR